MGEVSVRDIGNSNLLVSYDGKFSFRTAAANGSNFVALADLAKCCGYKAGGKFAIRTNVPKVKMDVRHIDGRTVGRVSPMWFLSVDDAVQFVKERALDDGFKRWFTGYADTIRNFPRSIPQDNPESSSPSPAHQEQKAPEVKPNRGVNITSELIDRIIVDLLSLKQVISSAPGT